MTRIDAGFRTHGRAVALIAVALSVGAIRSPTANAQTYPACFKLNVKSSYGFTQIWPDYQTGPNSYYTEQELQSVINSLNGSGWQAIGWANFCTRQCKGTYPGCSSTTKPAPTPRTPQPTPTPTPPKPTPPSAPCTTWYWVAIWNGNYYLRGPFSSQLHAQNDIYLIITNYYGANIVVYPYCQK